MKILNILIAVAFFATSTFAFTEHAFAILDELAQIENSQSLDQSDRQKRAASHNSTTTHAPTTASPTTASLTGDDVTCVTNPLREFQHEIRSNLSIFSNLTDPKVGYEGHQFYSRLNEENLNALCKIYIPRRAQIVRCAYSTIKNYTTDALAIFDYICLERYDDLKTAMPCLRKIDPEISKTCTPVCSDAKDKKDGFTNLDSNSTGPGAAGNDSDHIRASFARFCSHIQCLIICQTPIVKKQCGPPPIRMIHDGVHLLFAKLSSLNKLSSLQEYWPKVCSDLATEDFYAASINTTPAAAVTKTPTVTTTPAAAKKKTSG